MGFVRTVITDPNGSCQLWCVPYEPGILSAAAANSLELLGLRQLSSTRFPRNRAVHRSILPCPFPYRDLEHRSHCISCLRLHYLYALLSSLYEQMTRASFYFRNRMCFVKIPFSCKRTETLCHLKW